MPQQPPTFKKLPSYQNRAMAYFYSQIEQQKQVLQHIRAVLPEPLAKHALHCLIKEKKLLVYTDSAVWASQLRFYNNIILASIAQAIGKPVEMMQIKIITMQTGVSLYPKRTANIPSMETIEIIQSHSLTVSDDQLQQALLKLSSTLKRLSGKA